MSNKLSGVYKITCLPTGKFYIGSAMQFSPRWSLHKVQLRQGKHHSPYLQNAWNKHGPDAFKFEVLLVCAPEMVLVYEQIIMDATKPQFNTCKIAGSAKGVKHSDDARHRMRAAQRATRAKYEYQGKTLCLLDIAEAAGVDYNLLMSRMLSRRMTLEQALSLPPPAPTLYTHEGRSMRLTEWAKELDVNAARLRHYLKHGVEISEVIRRLGRKDKALSMIQFCELSGANVTTVKSRVAKGMGIMEAITTPAAITGIRHRVMEAA